MSNEPDVNLIKAYQTKNKLQFYKHLSQQVPAYSKKIQQVTVTSQQQEKMVIEPYEIATRKFLYLDNVFSQSKQFFDSALKEVHPQIRYSNSKKTKNMLRSICKVFIQELAQNSIQVMSQMERAFDQESKNLGKGLIDPKNTKKQITLDVEVVNEAYRRMSTNTERETILKNAFRGNNRE